MKKTFYRLLLFLLLLLISGITFAASEQKVPMATEEVDVRKLVFDHIEDSYQWHITNVGDRPVVIPLPIIVKGTSSGWHCFLSSRLEPTGEYQGFYLSTDGDYKGKLVERNAAGEAVRPIDLSITKTAFSLLFNSALLIILILSVAHWYKNKPQEAGAPKGFIGAMEMFVMMVNDDIIKSCIGEGYKRYAPYLLTVFFFILINNVMGLIPLFPGGANVMGNIAITMVLALCTFLVVNLFGNKEYWKEILWPDVPLWLKFPVPLMPLIELVGIFTKPFALMIRLFANMMAGHAVILALTSLIFITVSMGPLVNGTMTVVSVFFSIFMNCLELLVAFIQAYVFTMLSAVFIALSRARTNQSEL